MRTFVLAALSTVAFARRGQGRVGGMWWGAAPDCAQTCLSSAYSSEATMTTWPDPGHFCTASVGAPLSSCLVASCSATPTAYSSMASLSQSLCSVWSSCTSASDSVYTITLNLPTGTGRYASSYGPFRTYSGDGTVTVTGCPTAGVGFGGYGGYGGGGYGHINPWGGVGNPDDCFWGWGQGWSSLTTMTSTATSTVTDANGSTSETLVVQTYAQAVTDGTTTTTAVGATDATGTGTSASSTATGTAGSTGNSAGSANEVALMGAALAAVVAVAGLL